VLFGTVRPDPLAAANKIRSAARPWCVDSTCVNGNRSVTTAQTRTGSTEWIRNGSIIVQNGSLVITGAPPS
jgi:hypothetical protein